MFLSANPTLVAIVAGVIVIGVLIFVHELGHFLAAKAVGIAVLRFSFGLGPRTPIGVRVGETDYCISWIPFGGFVKMAGLEEEGAPGSLEGARQEREVPPERTFDAKPLWARIVVILAGVAMNALFAVALYVVVARAYGVRFDPTLTVGSVDASRLPMGAAALRSLQAGDRIVRINGDSVSSWDDVVQALLAAPTSRIIIDVAGRSTSILVEVSPSEAARDSLAGAIEPWHEPIVGTVVSGQPAAQAGLRQGDRIVTAGGHAVPSWEVLVGIIEGSAGRPLELEVRRGGQELRLTTKPQATRTRDLVTGETRVVGRIGIGAPNFPSRPLGWLAATGEGLGQTVRAGGLILWTFKGLFTGAVSVRDIGGPILVGQMSGQFVQRGLDYFLGFIALFSINLAILNLLPIPVLDGGHVVFLLIEGVRGRPLSLEQRQRLTQIGFFVLVGIMALALANDFLRLFR
ncbi:MAG: RIP metalloprotease RseP [Gemmatimonadales bacterium]